MRSKIRGSLRKELRREIKQRHMSNYRLVVSEIMASPLIGGRLRVRLCHQGGEMRIGNKRLPQDRFVVDLRRIYKSKKTGKETYTIKGISLLKEELPQIIEFLTQCNNEFGYRTSDWRSRNPKPVEPVKEVEVSEDCNGNRPQLHPGVQGSITPNP